MSWLTNYVRPKIRALVNKEDVPENLWHQCKSCEQMVFHRELEANLRVCPNCGNHMRLSCTRRMESIFDEGGYELIDLPEAQLDPLKFRDRKRYADRLKDSRSSTGRKDAIIVGKGLMGGKTVVAAVFDFEFMGGSMGTAVGDAILEAANVAVAEKAPLIIFPSSGGARMQEGILSLMQMPRTTIAVDQVKEAGLPYIVVLTDPTTGGVTASFAMLGDISIAEPGAVIGFAGARVIEETIREKLPEGFQRAEYLLEHGMIDMVVPRHDMRATLVRVIDLLMNRAAATEENTVVAIAPPEDPVEAEDIEERRAAE